MGGLFFKLDSVVVSVKPFLTFAGVLVLSVLLGFGKWKLQNLHDNVKGEPVLTEHAKVHTKSEAGGYRRSPPVFYIHFYVPERDTVVVCKVPKGIWEYLPKNDWGVLHHQGGAFFSFQRDCDGEVVDPESYIQIWEV